MLTRTFAQRLRTARERAGISQAELAGRVGATKAWISQLECGKPARPYLDTALKLAQALGCELADLWPSAAALR